MGKPGKFVRINRKVAKSSTKIKKKPKQQKNKKLEQKIKETVKSKPKKLKVKSVPSKSVIPVPKTKHKPTSDGEKKDFQEDLVDRLKGSRFRFINEQLYTHKGDDALEIFKQDETAFQTYHEGYRKQVEQWPINPLDRIIKSIKKLPLHYIVADFGCGEGRLAKTISQKCYSMDLVAADKSVIACDMAHTPLQTDSINVAVYCLSLMGTNLKDFLLEANRVLKIGGHLKIAEIESRFENVNQFIKLLENYGFQILSKDVSTKVFYFLYFKKIRNVDDSKKLPSFSLKPCLYKKR